MPAFTRSRRMSHSNSAKTASMPANARPLGVVRSSASLNETKPIFKAVQFLQGGDEVDQRPSPAIEPPYDDDIDFSSTGGAQQFLAPRTGLGSRADFLDRRGDPPAFAFGIGAHGLELHGQRLLIVGRAVAAVAATQDMAIRRPTSERAPHHPARHREIRRSARRDGNLSVRAPGASARKYPPVRRAASAASSHRER